MASRSCLEIVLRLRRGGAGDRDRGGEAARGTLLPRATGGAGASSAACQLVPPPVPKTPKIDPQGRGRRGARCDLGHRSSARVYLRL